MTETVAGICGAVILLVIMAVAVLFIRRKWRYETGLKSTNSNSSGCEETNTWKYSSGGTDRSDNLTPNSYYSDSFTQNYEQNPPQYHYHPVPITQVPLNNRHSAIIDNYTGSPSHFRTASTPPTQAFFHQPTHFGTAPRDQTYQI